MELLDTIVALATPRQPAAIAVVRLSGPQTTSILAHLVRRSPENIAPNSALPMGIYSDAKNPETLIDRAVVTFFKGPRSFTGEDTVEFSLHGSVDIADAVIAACIAWGARPARPGEFTMKAAVNGKVTLPQAEAVDALIRAPSSRARTLALRGVSGETSRQLESIRDDLLTAIAEAEYTIEDDITNDDDQRAIASVVDHSLPLAHRIHLAVSQTLERAKQGQRIARGITAVIAGEPNVGKSSLLNALVDADRAIVTPIPGTTRDIVEGQAEIGGILFRFLDTAGLRSTPDPVESLGIQRALDAIASADVVLLVSDQSFESLSGEQLRALKGKPVIRIGNKADLHRIPGADLYTSALNGDIASLKAALLKFASLDDSQDAICLSARDLGFLTRLDQALSQAEEALSNGYIDAYSDMIRQGIILLDDMLGHSKGQSGEDIYQTIFSHFCLGK